MGKHAQLVMGPAGSGKSTYCKTIFEHCENSRRTVHVVNLDPAAENFDFPVSVDIKELISVDEVMDELGYGPNGGLIYAMDYFLDNIEWFEEQLGDYEDDYLLIDCPGQIELYSHMNVMKSFVGYLENWGYRVCSVFCLDSQFIIDPTKFLAGSLVCLSSMIRLELPHVSVMTKMDLLGKAGKSKKMENYFTPDPEYLVFQVNKEMGKRYHKLSKAIGTLIDEWSLVNFIPLDRTDESSIENLIEQIDMVIQYGEDLDVKQPKELDDEEEEEQFNDIEDYAAAQDADYDE